MPEDPRTALSTRVQAWLGLDRIHTHLHRMENLMASAKDQLDALTTKVEDIATDVRVLRDKQGQLDAEGQAALDRLTSKLSDLDVEVGDQDGSDTPTETPIQFPPAGNTPVTDEQGDVIPDETGRNAR